jgi:type I restriction enzyme S subunit
VALTASVDDLVARNENGLLGKHPTWARVRLGDVATVQNGFAFESRYFNTEGRGVPLLRIRDVVRGSTETWYEGPYDEAYVVQRDDLVTGMDGDFNHALWRGPPALLNQRVCRLSFSSVLLRKRFAFRALGGYLEAINEATSSVTVRHLSSRTVAELPLPLPPAEEQDRIVSALESEFEQIDTGTAGLEGALRGLQQLRLASLGGVFAKDHPRVRVDEVGTVFVGFTPSRKDPTLWDGDVPWVSSGEVAFGRISATRETIADAALGNRDRRLHPPGTVLLAMYGEGKTRGQAAILDVPAATNQAVAAIRVDSTRMTPEFLFYCLMRKYNEVRATGRGGQQINLNGELIRSIELPQPPMEEQRRLVAELEEWLAAASRLAADLTANLKAADALRRSIMNQAMTGTLVPQDASDEPASELLERVKVEKAQRESAHRRPRRRSPAPSATAG